MDYVKAYNKLCEHHSNQIDFINFIENKMEVMNKRMNINEEDKLMKEAEKLRQTLDRVKQTEMILLKELHELEIMVEVVKK